MDRFLIKCALTTKTQNVSQILLNLPTQAAGMCLIKTHERVRILETLLHLIDIINQVKTYHFMIALQQVTGLHRP